MSVRDPDLDLLDRWREGDKAAGQALFQRHYACIARFFRNKVSAGHKDLVQKTFLTCVERRDAVRGESTYRGYLFGVANYVLLNHLRGRRRKLDPVDYGTVSMAAIDPSPSVVVAERKEQQHILLALREVPLQCQVVLELYYWEQMDRNQIAAALDIAPGTAASRLRRGRELLRDALEKRMADPTAFANTVSHLDEWAAALAQQVREAK